MTTTITAQDMQDRVSDLINQVAHNKEQVIVTRRDKKIAALISYEDYLLLQELKNKQDLAEALDALKEARDKGSITLEKVKSELELDNGHAI